MKKPTIYDIKYAVQGKSNYFDRKALKFFGQTMKDYSVTQTKDGRIFISAPIYLNKKVIGYSEREFIKETNELKRVEKQTESEKLI